jgi:hypothetical protein
MLLLVLLAVGCDGTVDISDDSSGGGDDTAENYEFTGPEPVIFGGDAVCSGDDSWDFTLAVGDQQGADTVTGGRFQLIEDGDGSIEDDGGYDCKGGTCAGTASGGFCSKADRFKFLFKVTDADGNESRGFEVYGHN